MATQAARGYNPLAVGTQRPIANPGTTLQLDADTDITRRAWTNMSLWLFVLGTFTSVAIGFFSWFYPNALTASTGLTFLTASTVGSQTLPQNFTLAPIANFSHDINLKYAFVALAVPAWFLGFLFFAGHAVSGKGRGWEWFNIARNSDYAHKAGIQIFSSFWCVMVDGPLFAFVYLWAGERSFETIFLTMLLVSLILVFPTFFDVLLKCKNNGDLYNDTHWGNLRVVMWVASTILAVSIVFIWVLFLERVMQNGRLGISNGGVNAVNWIFTIYITWWMIYHISGIIRDIYRLHNGETTAPLKAARYVFSIANTVFYTVVLLTLASVIVVHH
jgi:hypothetical protein